MGFFSGVGKALKKVAKVVSFKNVVNVATGNTGAVLSDFKGRIGEGVQEFSKSAVSSVKADITKVGTNLTNKLIKPSQAVKLPANLQFAVKSGTTGNEMADKAIDYLGGKALNKLDEKAQEVKNKIYAKPEVKGFMDILKKEALGYYWQEYKTRIIVSASVLLGLAVWFFKFRNKKGGRRR